MEALGGVSVRCYAVSGCAGGGGGRPRRLDAQSSVGFRKTPCRRRSKGIALGVSSGDYFRERDHLDYYSNNSSGRGGKMIWCGKGKGDCKVVDKKKEKETKEKKMMMKKKLKKMLQAQIQGGDFPISPVSDDQVKVAQMISDAAEKLLEQLQQQREEGKDLETISRDGFEIMSSESSSSSSSESSESDSDCGEVVTDFRSQKKSCNSVVVEPGKPQEAETFSGGTMVEDGIVNHNFQLPVSATEVALVSISAATDQLNLSSLAQNSEQLSQLMKSAAATAGVLSPSTKKVEVCMGGKCKKSGSVALLGEFQRRLGIECAAVTGCKCMGRCREGPNVRISNEAHTNSLFIGVGLTDVDAIVANYLEQSPEFSLNAP